MRHERLTNIACGISGISQVIQEDLKRKACEGDSPFLNDYRLGCLMSALEELATQADCMADAMQEEWEANQ